MEQWYLINKPLFDLEVKTILSEFPNAKWGMTSEKELYFDIEIKKEAFMNNWTIRAVFNTDYPQLKYGGSIYGGALKVYPLHPNYDEMMDMVLQSPFQPKPDRLHFMMPDADRISEYKEGNEHKIFSIGNRKMFKHVSYGGHISALVYIRETIKIISIFELAMYNKEAWDILVLPPYTW